MYKFKPILKSMLWGGEKIIPYKGVESAMKSVGESWEISGVKDNESVVAEGPDAGMKLPELIARDKGALVGQSNYERFGKDTPLILSGVSMGATTVLMASDLELPETVCGIIADCPYSSPRDIITKVAGEFGLPRKPAAALCSLGAWLYGHFKVGDGSALDSVSRTKLPILLLHGEEDQLVPCQMSRKIYDACNSDKELQTFPGASHGMSYLEDPQRYEATVGRFLARCLHQEKP